PSSLPWMAARSWGKVSLVIGIRTSAGCWVAPRPCRDSPMTTPAPWAARIKIIRTPKALANLHHPNGRYRGVGGPKAVREIRPPGRSLSLGEPQPTHPGIPTATAARTEAHGEVMLRLPLPGEIDQCDLGGTHEPGLTW